VGATGSITQLVPHDDIANAASGALVLVANGGERLQLYSHAIEPPKMSLEERVLRSLDSFHWRRIDFDGGGWFR
jgi:hypothetical protein